MHISDNVQLFCKTTSYHKNCRKGYPYNTGIPFWQKITTPPSLKKINLCIKSFHLVSLLPFWGVNKEFFFILRRFHAILFKDMPISCNFLYIYLMTLLILLGWRFNCISKVYMITEVDDLWPKWPSLTESCKIAHRRKSIFT